MTVVEGVYENHHLLCPVHGRTTPSSDGKTLCGCTPQILWKVVSYGESEMHSDDNLGIGSRYV